MPATPIIPAHIAKKVGFNNGFQNFGPAVQVSGGPYMIQSYAKGQDLVEVRNPHYWGTTAKLNKIIFRFILDDTQIPPAMQNGEVNLANPTLASVAFNAAVRAVPNTTTNTIPGLQFQHMDFNQANPYLAVANVRHAIAYGTNRAQMVQRIVAPIAPSIKALQNRIWMPTQPQYQNTSGGYGTFDPGKAKALLQQSNMTMGSDGYFHPNFGPQKGKDLTISISTTSGVPVRSQIEQLFQANMKAIGIKINIQNYDASTLFGTVGPKGEFDIIEFAWVLTPFASGNQSIYCSYTNAAPCGQNWNHYANTQVDSLFDQAIADTRPGQVGQPVQPDRLDSVEGHGHAAAVPAAKPDQLVQQVRQHRAQPQPRRRPVERPAVGAEGLMSRHHVSPGPVRAGGDVVPQPWHRPFFDRSADNSNVNGYIIKQ